MNDAALQHLDHTRKMIRPAERTLHGQLITRDEILRHRRQCVRLQTERHDAPAAARELQRLRQQCAHRVHHNIGAKCSLFFDNSFHILLF